MTPDDLRLAVTEFALRARAAGHPVIRVGVGVYVPLDRAAIAPGGDLTPNDLLQVARETARSRVEWVHAVLPSYTDAVRLAAALQPSTLRTAGRSRLDRGRGRDRHDSSFAALVDETPLSVVTLTIGHGLWTVHVVEIPVPWLGRPLGEVTTR